MACSAGKGDDGSGFSGDASEAGAEASESAASSSSTQSSEVSTTQDESEASGPSSGPVLDIMGSDEGPMEWGDDCDEPPPPPDLTLTGTVFAPNGEIPIADALVYTVPARTDIEGIPEDGVYCDECIDLPCHHYDFTNADGSFELDANIGPDQKFIVQKGQFMRIVDIDIQATDTTIDPAMSTFPSQWNPDAGEYIPKIAVTVAPYDQVHDVLAKMGLGQVTMQGKLEGGPENRSFELYSSVNQYNNQLGGLLGGGLDLLNDIDEMDKYHIIFIPCGAENDMVGDAGLGSLDDITRDNIRDWVSRGGKLYVTDNALEYLDVPFGPYQTFWEVNGNPDLPSGYDTQGTVLDNDLLDWLNALPPELQDIGQGEPTLNMLPQVTVEGAWSAIEDVHSVTVDDMGEAVEVGHKVWVEGPVEGGVTSSEDHPLTVTGEYGCGRIMFSNYHTGDTTHSGVNPQELLLLYLILEIGVCASNPVPPPPVD